MPFLQVYFNHELKLTVPVQPTSTAIGRASNNDLVIDNSGVSGYHAAIIRRGDDFFIEDMNSTNGVYVNGRRISRESLHYGDEITIFKHKLKFIAVDLSDSVSNNVQQSRRVNQDQTMMVNSDQLQAILNHQQSHAPYLEAAGGNRHGQKWILSKSQFNIGKSSDCELRVGGWFTPRLIAKITRQSDGYYLMPEKKGKVYLNGTPLKRRFKLKNGDRLKVRDLALIYHQAVAAPTLSTQ